MRSFHGGRASRVGIGDARYAEREDGYSAVVPFC
jgi:hypothetical protein